MIKFEHRLTWDGVGFWTLAVMIILAIIGSAISYGKLARTVDFNTEIAIKHDAQFDEIHKDLGEIHKTLAILCDRENKPVYIDPPAETAKGTP